MKKKYEKPVLIIEPFQLDATVAASCSSEGHIPLNYNENICMDETGGFFGTQCDVNLVKPGADLNDEICYHGPILTGGQAFMKS